MSRRSYYLPKASALRQTVRIRRNGLRAASSLPVQTNHSSKEGATRATAKLYDLVIRVRVRTRGEQIKLIVGNRGDQVWREEEAALIKAVARAHLWFERLKSGDAASVRQIAKAEEVTGSYVSRILKLAFLAPDIVEAILDGRHPVDLTAERLLVHEDLPSDWSEQQRQLGLAPL